MCNTHFMKFPTCDFFRSNGSQMSLWHRPLYILTSSTHLAVTALDALMEVGSWALATTCMAASAFGAAFIEVAGASTYTTSPLVIYHHLNNTRKDHQNRTIRH